MAGYEESNGLARSAMMSYVEVILPLPLEKTFVYSVSEELVPAIQVGVRVLVPFRTRILTGIVFQIKKEPPQKDIQVKPILSVLDEKPIVNSSFIDFLQDLSQISFVAAGELLKVALPPTFLVEEKGKYRLLQKPEKEEIKQQFGKRSGQVEAVLNLLSSNKALSWRYLQRKVDFPGLLSLLRRLASLGWVKLERKIKLRKRKASASLGEIAQLKLDFHPEKEFEPYLAGIEKSLQKREFKTFLLFGSKARREDFFLSLLRKWGSCFPYILILVPEIAEISSFLEKITGLIDPKRIALLHGELSPKKRESTWLRIWRGEANLVIGPRSAVFAPLPEIQLIYLTEEADESYVHPSPFYDAREAAKLRAQKERAIILYGSSAPSVSFYTKARNQGFLLDLGQQPGKIKVLSYPSGGAKILSPDLQRMISERLSSGQRIALLVNRRGYASLLTCLRCGLIALCPQCRRPLTLYSRKEKLVCHQCGFSEPRWSRCPECQSSVIGAKGYGLEAVEAEVKRLWPDVSIKAIQAEGLRAKEKLGQLKKEFDRGKLEIIIGTQFLLPHINWRKISLTAVLAPETMLAYPDFRSGERVFYLIRRLQEEIDTEGHRELIIQTATPENYVVKALAENNYYELAKAELRFRRFLGLPPWKCLVRVVLSGRRLRGLGRQAREIRTMLAASSGIEEILGPSVLPSAKGKYQVQMWLKGKEKKEIIFSLSSILKEIKTPFYVEIID